MLSIKKRFENTQHYYTQKHVKMYTFIKSTFVLRFKGYSLANCPSIKIHFWYNGSVEFYPSYLLLFHWKINKHFLYQTPDIFRIRSEHDFLRLTVVCVYWSWNGMGVPICSIQDTFSIQSYRSCYATQHLCQRSFYKILVKLRNSKKKCT